MREQIDLGPTPGEESCQQMGDNYDARKARIECQVYKDQLYRQFAKRFEARSNDSTVALVVRGFEHDFGRYLEVCVTYDPDIAGDLEFALEIENNLPGNWDEESIEKLKSLGVAA